MCAKKNSLGISYETVVPSTKLCSVSVHKLADTVCSRYYYWRWVMNLIPRSFNINLWFGSVVHAGIEAIGQKKKVKKTAKIMARKDKAICDVEPPDANTLSEVKIQRVIAHEMVKYYRKLVKKKLEHYEIGGTEVHFKKKLRESSVILEGTLDAWYQNSKRIVLFEGKTSSKPNNAYFKRLVFDKQINMYADGLRDLTGRLPRYCYYTVFRKPQIRQRKTETPEDFIDRLRKDLKEREKWYFIFYKHKFGKNAVKAVLNDIEWMTFDLQSKYDYLSTDQLLDLRNWPRNDAMCFHYGTCPYFTLCSRSVGYQMYYRYYTMRDVRYDGELDELDGDRAFTTRPVIKRRK